MIQFRILLVMLCGLALHHPSIANEDTAGSIRFATFNIAMGLETQGELLQRLQSGDDEGLRKVAGIIQHVRPDVLLLNEFDRHDVDSSILLITQYLEKPQAGQQAINFPHTVSGAVNTGQDSGMDLNNNDILGEPEDAWGYGRFPGQYGMLVLSRFPLNLERNFRFFKWIDMPGAMNPVNSDGTAWYSDVVRKQLRLSSKSHWDISLDTGNGPIHFLVSHPTPPVFDGPEDRNGARNHDEIRLWTDYIDPAKSTYLYSHDGIKGGLRQDAMFIIAGDLNADPVDGDSRINAIGQLLDHPLINASCVPRSEGALEASNYQRGKNQQHKGNAAADTADFNDEYTGNMRIDYVLPSATLRVVDCGVFWPAREQPGHELIDASDHRLVWVDIIIP